jgi:hypothetical protein
MPADVGMVFTCSGVYRLLAGLRWQQLVAAVDE